MPDSNVTKAAYSLGFTSLEHEVEIDRLPVRGNLPSWLAGTLVRNGPAKFEVGTQSFRHWFDGLGMLHRFAFKDGIVSYANKFLRSRDYLQSTTRGKSPCVPSPPTHVGQYSERYSLCFSQNLLPTTAMSTSLRSRDATSP